MSEALDDDTLEDWSSRQLAESSWVAKLAAQWFRRICPDVSVSRGRLTAHLRRIWKLDTVIAEARFGEGRPVLDDDGKEITKQEFDRYRRYWEGHDEQGVERTDRRIEKRIDHRHHLVDALVIGLADRKLYRRMADNYKERAERARAGEKVKLTLSEAPPIPDIRERVLELMRRCIPEHRHDRYPDGQLFKEQPHGIDLSSSKLTMRAKLVDLADSSPAKTRQTLEAIASAITRQAVIEEFDRRVAAGKAPKEALAEPMLHPVNKTRIVRVRMLGDRSETAKRIEWKNTRPNPRKPYRPHYKYLVHAGNAYLEIRQNGNGKVEARLVKPVDALNEKGTPPPSGVVRIYKGDTLLDPKNNVRYLVKQIKTRDDEMIIAMPVIETTEVRDANKRFGLKRIKQDDLPRFRIVE